MVQARVKSKCLQIFAVTNVTISAFPYILKTQAVLSRFEQLIVHIYLCMLLILNLIRWCILAVLGPWQYLMCRRWSVWSVFNLPEDKLLLYDLCSDILSRMVMWEVKMPIQRYCFDEIWLLVYRSYMHQ